MRYNYLYIPVLGVLLDYGSVSVWLFMLMAVNRYSAQTVTILIPYLAPVLFIAWRHGALAGIAVAAFATFAAAPRGYVASHDTGQVLWAVLFTYSQMTSAVFAVACAKWLYQRKIHG